MGTHESVHLFDDMGRRILPQGLLTAVHVPYNEYAVVQTVHTLVDHYQRINAHHYEEITDLTISVNEYRERYMNLWKGIESTREIANILKGVCIPLLIPKMAIEDYGKTAEFLVRIVQNAYLYKFPERVFTNYCRNDLQGKVSVIPGSRHERLILKMAHDSVMALYFPNALLGYSPYAMEEQMKTLPQGLLLSGVIDTAIAWIMYPEMMGRTMYTPIHQCAAVAYLDTQHSLRFYVTAPVRGSKGIIGNFSSSYGLSVARGHHSGGLLYIE